MKQGSEHQEEEQQRDRALTGLRILVLEPLSCPMPQLCEALAAYAGPRGVERVGDGPTLLERLGAGLPYDLVLVDVSLGDGRKSGPDIIRAIRRRDRTTAVVAMAEHGDVSTAGSAIEAGATDFLVRAGDLAERVTTLLGKVRGVLALAQQNRLLAEQNRLLAEAQRARYRIVGDSPEIRAVVERIERVARIPRPVLILGERGTGKELVARAVHDAGGGAERPFVAINCAAFADALLESELFGHEKGAFTGADRLLPGRFEQASGGTLFLDEIGNMSLPFQQKILRAVEYGVFTRVGGRHEIHTDTRIIAATNTDLEARMQRGEFLRDLWDRLTFEIIAVPPLRARRGDIAILVRHFFACFLAEIPALGGKRFSPEAIAALEGYAFPGNVRELKNVVERATYRDTTNEITPEDLGLPSGSALSELHGATFKEKVESLERHLLEQALARSSGNQAQAARELGLSYDQARYYLRKHALGRS